MEVAVELDRYLERNVARHVVLTERFYYQPEQRISTLASELGVDRNTALSDIDALRALLSPYVRAHERRRGTVLVRFDRATTLLELIQHVYRESNLLLLCNEYLTGKVDVAAFARRRGLSVSAAYALSRKAATFLGAAGGTVRRSSLDASELAMRYISILVRTALGFRPPVLEAHLPGVNRMIAALESRLGLTLTDLDRSFLRASTGLALERGGRPLDQGFLEVVADMPEVAFFEEDTEVDGRRFGHQEALFMAAMSACVSAKNRISSTDALALWADGDASYRDLEKRMRAHFGKKACETELFRAALRRLFLFIRLGAAATAFTQDRPIPDARRPVLDACREIVKAWSQTFAPAGAGENDDLIVQFVLQILPLIDIDTTPERICCAIVTASELNRLTIAAAIERQLPGTAHALERACSTIEAAGAELARLLENAREMRGIIVVDREYALETPRETGSYPIVGTSVAEEGEMLARHLQASTTGGD